MYEYSGQPSDSKYQWGIYTHVSMGDCTQLWSKDTPANHVNLASLVPVCNLINSTENPVFLHANLW